MAYSRDPTQYPYRARYQDGSVMRSALLGVGGAARAPLASATLRKSSGWVRGLAG